VGCLVLVALLLLLLLGGSPLGFHLAQPLGPNGEYAPGLDEVSQFTELRFPAEARLAHSWTDSDIHGDGSWYVEITMSPTATAQFQKALPNPEATKVERPLEAGPGSYNLEPPGWWHPEAARQFWAAYIHQPDHYRGEHSGEQLWVLISYDRPERPVVYLYENVR
jgi:hypothetical protein